MESGDRDPRPPIEIWGDEPAAESVEVVTTGLRSRRSRVRALAAFAGIVALLVGGLMLGDDPPAATERGASGDDEPESATDGTTTERRVTTTLPEPTTTTIEVLPGAPLLGEPSGLQLVTNYQVIDLDTGGITQLTSRVFAVTERRLIVAADGTVSLWPAPYDGSGSTRIASVPAGRVLHAAWVVDEGSMVWLLQGPPGQGGAGQPFTADLVDLDGRTVAHLDIRDGLWPSGAVDRGVVVSGAGGIYVIDRQGAAERIATGDLIAVAHNRVHAYTCDERLQCGLEVLDERGQRLDWSPVEGSSPGGQPSGFGVAVAPDGRRAFIVYRDETTQVLIDGVVVLEAAATGNPAWSPDGRWLAIPADDSLHFIDTRGDTGPIALEIGPTETQSLNIFSSV